MRRPLLAVTLLGIMIGASPSAARAQRLYGAIGRGSTANPGGLVIVDQTNGTETLLPVIPPRNPGNTGLAFGLDGTLWDTIISGNVFGGTPVSALGQRDPTTGALIGTPVPVRFGGQGIAITDLAVQPGTGMLFGTNIVVSPTAPPVSKLYTIDPLSGAASLVGTFFVPGAPPFPIGAQAIAFAPDGTLYLTELVIDPTTGSPVDARLDIVNPATAAILTQGAPLGVGEGGLGGLAVRPDGVIFASSGPEGNIYRVDLTSATLLGALGQNAGVGGPGDLAFAPVPEPATLLLLAAGLVPIAWTRRARRSSRHGRL